MKVLFVIGTRPEAIKLCPVIAESNRTPGIETLVLSTGQHRDMLIPILSAFDVTPDFDLDIMSPNQTPTTVAAKVLGAIGNVLDDTAPDWVVIQGDTTTVCAAGIAGFYSGRRVAHVEAGLRTQVRHEPFPEEINRRLAAVVSDLHFAPTENARANLLAENIPEESIIVSGNTVIDALEWSVKLDKTAAWLEWNKKAQERVGCFEILLTAHRRENLGAPLERICDAVIEICNQLGNAVHFTYPVHRNPNVREVIERRLGTVKQISLLDPLDYVSLIHLMKSADLILTDSGGIQEEAPALGKPVLVLREVTERPEGVAAGTAKLVGTSASVIVDNVLELIQSRESYAEMARAANPYGDGKASQRIMTALRGEPVVPFGKTNARPSGP